MSKCEYSYTKDVQISKKAWWTQRISSVIDVKMVSMKKNVKKLWNWEVIRLLKSFFAWKACLGNITALIRLWRQEYSLLGEHRLSWSRHQERVNLMSLTRKVRDKTIVENVKKWGPGKRRMRRSKMTWIQIWHWRCLE